MEEQSLADFLAWEPDYPDSILERGLMYAETKTIIYGQYKSMKSMLAQRFALAVARGEPWLGFNTPELGASVFYVQSEIPHRQLQSRMRKMVGGRANLQKELTVWTERSLKLDQPTGMAKLERKLERYRPQVLIIDPIYKVITGDMKEQAQVNVFLDNMDGLIDKHGVTIVLISHSRKAISDPEVWGSDDLLGSVFFSAWPDSIFKVTRAQSILTVKFEVLRHAEEDIEPIQINIDDKLQFDQHTINIGKAR